LNTLKKALPRLLIGGGLFFLLLFGSGAYFYYKTGPFTTAAVVKIPAGFSLNQIAGRLASQHLITSPFLFKSFVYLRGRTDQLRAGTYIMPAGASMADIIAQLTTSVGEMMTITIPEGLTVRQIADLLGKEVDIHLDHTQLPSEGALFPETYKIVKGTSSQQLFTIMQAEMQRVLADLWPTRQEGLPLQSPEDAVILASIVERETARPEERPMVAAVYLNRLKKGMRLQADPTTIYALSAAQGVLDRPLLIKDLLLAHAHNTYQNKGLPPTAIANPGYESLKAVMQPAKTKALYFVADGKGGHLFANTLSQHQRYVTQYVRAKKKRMTACKKR